MTANSEFREFGGAFCDVVQHYHLDCLHKMRSVFLHPNHPRDQFFNVARDFYRALRKIARKLISVSRILAIGLSITWNNGRASKSALYSP